MIADHYGTMLIMMRERLQIVVSWIRDHWIPVVSCLGFLVLIVGTLMSPWMISHMHQNDQSEYEVHEIAHPTLYSTEDSVDSTHDPTYSWKLNDDGTMMVQALTLAGCTPSLVVKDEVTDMGLQVTISGSYDDQQLVSCSKKIGSQKTVKTTWRQWTLKRRKELALHQWSLRTTVTLTMTNGPSTAPINLIEWGANRSS
jgi:hypothetical protein